MKKIPYIISAILLTLNLGCSTNNQDFYEQDKITNKLSKTDIFKSINENEIEIYILEKRLNLDDDKKINSPEFKSKVFNNIDFKNEFFDYEYSTLLYSLKANYENELENNISNYQNENFIKSVKQFKSDKSEDQIEYDFQKAKTGFDLIFLVNKNDDRETKTLKINFDINELLEIKRLDIGDNQYIESPLIDNYSLNYSIEFKNESFIVINRIKKASQISNKIIMTESFIIIKIK